MVFSGGPHENIIDIHNDDNRIANGESRYPQSMIKYFLKDPVKWEQISSKYAEIVNGKVDTRKSYVETR